MSAANVGWDSPQIVGELHKLGIDEARSTVEKYRVRSRKSPSPRWKTFLKNHVRDLVSIDFSVVPTVRNNVLFVLVVLAHHRRRVVHFNVTEHPTAQWTSQQIIEAFPWDTAPKSTAGLRCYLWKRIQETRPKPGNRRGTYRASKPLAECICGTRDLQHPAGLLGLCCRVERSVIIGVVTSPRKGSTIYRGRWVTSSLRTFSGIVVCDMSFREAQAAGALEGTMTGHDHFDRSWLMRIYTYIVSCDFLSLDN